MKCKYVASLSGSDQYSQHKIYGLLKVGLGLIILLSIYLVKYKWYSSFTSKETWLNVWNVFGELVLSQHSSQFEFDISLSSCESCMNPQKNPFSKNVIGG